MKIVCRCEDVTEKEILQAMDEGFDDVETLHRYTGLGTGPCQGKYCAMQLIRIMAERKGRSVDGEFIKLYTQRPPVLPLRIGLADVAPLDPGEAPDDLGADVTVSSTV